MAPKKKSNLSFFLIKAKLVKLVQTLARPMNRGNAAHLMMILFVSLNAIGAWMFAPKLGFITAGVCSGIYGYLLGRD